MNFVFKHSFKILFGLMTFAILFHLCVMLKIIPYTIAWGGRLDNDKDMYIFESISILINLFLTWILLMKNELVKFRFSNKTINLILWIFFGIFVANTIGNIFAKTNLEKVFAILTGLLALFIWSILKNKNDYKKLENDELI